MPDATITGWNWVIASYALTWITLGVYTGYLMRRGARAEHAHVAPPNGGAAGR